MLAQGVRCFISSATLDFLRCQKSFLKNLYIVTAGFQQVAKFLKGLLMFANITMETNKIVKRLEITSLCLILAGFALN